MKVLVTGANGFVGPYVVSALGARGHDVIPLAGPGAATSEKGVVDVTDAESVEQALTEPFDAVVHLAAVASGRLARNDVGRAWEVNAAGTARVAETLGRLVEAGRADPLLLFASSIEVYGPGPPRPQTEETPPNPSSPYGASKAGAELACTEVARRTGLRVVIARAANHSGAGQPTGYVIPDFAAGIVRAEREGTAEVSTGSLEPVRDFLHVADVARAYALLVEEGRSGEAYNVGSGRGVPIRDLFSGLADAAGVDVRPKASDSLKRAGDIDHLVADIGKITDELGWTPEHTLEEVYREAIVEARQQVPETLR